MNSLTSTCRNSAAPCVNATDATSAISRERAARRTDFISLPEARAIASRIRPSCSPIRELVVQQTK